MPKKSLSNYQITCSYFELSNKCSMKFCYLIRSSLWPTKDSKWFWLVRRKYFEFCCFRQIKGDLKGRKSFGAVAINRRARETAVHAQKEHIIGSDFNTADQLCSQHWWGSDWSPSYLSCQDVWSKRKWNIRWKV